MGAVLFFPITCPPGKRIMEKNIEMRNNDRGMHVWISDDKVFVNPADKFYYGPDCDLVVEPCPEGHLVASIAPIDACDADWRLEICNDWFGEFFCEYYDGDWKDLAPDLLEYQTKFHVLAEVMAVLEEAARWWQNFPELVDEFNARIESG